ncbi:hypothetical protein [Flavobacterium sp.]|uniref:hypothetical protein n=1 Tax=Flavobacterium sp. TaxID=239 RepID=UPI00404815C9
MKKLIFAIIVIFCSFNQINAQKINFKKGFVLANDVEVLKYEKEQGGFETNIYTLDDTLVLQILDKKDFDRYLFLTSEKVVIESTEFDFYTHRQVLQLFFDKKVFNEKGELNSEKLNEFKLMYDEKITKRTIRIGN